MAVAVVAGGLVAAWPKYDGKAGPLTMLALPPYTNFITVKGYTIGQQQIRFTNAEPMTAITFFGSRSLPALVERLQIRQTTWTDWQRTLRNWRGRIGAGQSPIPPWIVELKRGQAVTGLIHLGDIAKPVLPQVLALAKSDPDPGVRASALEVLRGLSAADYAEVTNVVSVVVH